MAQDGQHRFLVDGRGQHSGSKRSRSTLGAAELDGGLAVESADRLLERIAGTIHIRAVTRNAVLESLLEGPAVMRHHQARSGQQASIFNRGDNTPTTA